MRACSVAAASAASLLVSTVSAWVVEASGVVADRAELVCEDAINLGDALWEKAKPELANAIDSGLILTHRARTGVEALIERLRPEPAEADELREDHGDQDEHAVHQGEQARDPPVPGGAEQSLALGLGGSDTGKYRRVGGVASAVQALEVLGEG